MLATKISFLNELANLAERLGADIERVRNSLREKPAAMALAPIRALASSSSDRDAAMAAPRAWPAAALPYGGWRLSPTPTTCGMHLRIYPEALADGRLILAATKEEATEGAHALVICTEWKRFMAPNFDQLAAALRHKLIFDGRNLYDPERLAELGWTYYAIGRGASVSPVA
jgi:UDP-N-acetyl-D-mannosaminuronate dehydrogenase